MQITLFYFYARVTLIENMFIRTRAICDGRVNNKKNGKQPFKPLLLDNLRFRS